jgi:hypothetical protein
MSTKELTDTHTHGMKWHEKERIISTHTHGMKWKRKNYFYTHTWYEMKKKESFLHTLTCRDMKKEDSFPSDLIPSAHQHSHDEKSPSIFCASDAFIYKLKSRKQCILSQHCYVFSKSLTPWMDSNPDRLLWWKILKYNTQYVCA